jgi:hypothetical protein
MEIPVLLQVEKIHHGSRHTGQFLKAPDRRGVHIHSADAAEPGSQSSRFCKAAVETTRSSSESAEQMEVADLDFRDTDAHLAYQSFALGRASRCPIGFDQFPVAESSPDANPGPLAVRICSL